MRQGGVLIAAVLALAPVAAFGQQPAPATPGSLNTLTDVFRALRACWRWPPLSESRPGMDLTVRLSFKRDGEIFGARISYQTRDASPQERASYADALTQALIRCSRLPLSASLGEAIAGRPMNLRFHDSRQQRKASIDG